MQWFVAAFFAQDLEPWASKSHPSDAPKKHVEEIAEAKHAYVVKQGGTMDGENCRTGLSVGMMDGPAIEQTWESNRAVRMENTGDTDIIDPWLSNGRNDYRTMEELVRSAVTPGMSDREKALALYWQEVRHRYHWGGDNRELCDPVRVFNVYGHNTCGNDSMCLAGLWRKAGLKVTPARLVGHCVSQVFFDGRWNLLDGDQHDMYLLRDGRTIASEQDLVRDHDLVKRSHTQGLLNPGSRQNDEWEASIYVYEGPPVGDRNCYESALSFVLRPNEAITWRWGHTTPIKLHGETKPRYPDLVSNGLWEYRPDFSKDVWRKGAEIQAVRTQGGELSTGTIIWTVRCPYVIVGGRIQAEGSGAKFQISWDGKTWEEAGADLDKFFPASGQARYEYRLKCVLEGDAKLKRLGIVHDLLMAPLALPGMAIGTNRFLYTDRSSGSRKVRITHEWIERSLSKPPEASGSAVYPPDKGDSAGTDVAFRWKAPPGTIADYQFELSEREDMRWPLSTNFYRLISKTPDRGKAGYTLEAPGLLSPDVRYFWHVRAKNDKGVWGAWSKTWSFTARGAAPPVDVSLDAKTGALRWKPSSAGSKPVKYRVYGSDEKGFTASDVPYKVNIGHSKELPGTFDSNFLAEVSDPQLVVLGSQAANKSFYRVVAVDERGKPSGPSDYASAPRPYLYAKQPPKAKAGSEFRWAVWSIRSLGDARTRIVDGREVMSFWDIEHPKFALAQGPDWLKIDEQSGALSGTPPSPGKFSVSVTASIDRGARKLDERALSWGQEKVSSTETERVGAATLEFVIDVEP